MSHWCVRSKFWNRARRKNESTLICIHLLIILLFYLFVLCLMYGNGIGSNNIRKNDCSLLKELTFWAWLDWYCSASPTHIPALFPAPFYAKNQSKPTASQKAPSVVWSFILKHAGQSAWVSAPWLAHWGQCWARTFFSAPSPVIRCWPQPLITLKLP